MVEQAALNQSDQGQSVQALYRQAQEFTAELANKGWINKEQINNTQPHSPADLFGADAGSRPLVVGLFGGTGVGKSTLLNRLAGQQIAKTGVVRPTSMEITAYVHEANDVAALPEGFPKENFASVTHNSSPFEGVMWVDMPDFDSEETQNREQVLQWLGYIDLLIYVVTPERYRDAEGWRLLRSHGYQHGWLFVINQWDKGDPAQLDDFRQLLQETGFNTPKIFTTSCTQAHTVTDDFEALSLLVTNLTERNVVDQLEQHGWLTRIEAAGRQLQQQQLALDEPQKEPVESFDGYWKTITDDIRLNLTIPFQEYSARFQQTQASPFKGAMRSLTGSVPTDGEHAKRAAVIRDAGNLWGDWSAQRLYDAIRQFELAQAEHGIPSTRLKAMSENLPGSFEKIDAQWPALVSNAAGNPGSSAHRKFVEVCGYLRVLLPIAVACWIAYRVLAGFINGATDRAAYVGVDFMVNGLLLGFVAWLIPFSAAHFLRPSQPRAVSRALNEALEHELQESVDIYRKQLPEVSQERAQLQERATALQVRINKVLDRAASLQNEDLEGLVLSSSTGK